MSDEPEFKPRGDEYLRGYRAAMEYAAAFTRDAGSGTPLEHAFGILAAHFQEKVRSTVSSAEMEAKLIATLGRVSSRQSEK